MAQKRYSIVRVDNSCPEYIEDFKCHFPDNSVECMKCSHHRYGDTKEQLIRKVAQVLIWKADEIRALKAYKLSREEKKVLDEEYFDLARKIVEFLGVE